MLYDTEVGIIRVYIAGKLFCLLKYWRRLRILTEF